MNIIILQILTIDSSALQFSASPLRIKRPDSHHGHTFTSRHSLANDYEGEWTAETYGQTYDTDAYSYDEGHQWISDSYDQQYLTSDIYQGDDVIAINENNEQYWQESSYNQMHPFEHKQSEQDKAVSFYLECLKNELNSGDAFSNHHYIISGDDASSDDASTEKICSTEDLYDDLSCYHQSFFGTDVVSREGNSWGDIAKDDVFYDQTDSEEFTHEHHNNMCASEGTQQFTNIGEESMCLEEEVLEMTAQSDTKQPFIPDMANLVQVAKISLASIIGPLSIRPGFSFAADAVASAPATGAAKAASTSVAASGIKPAASAGTTASVGASKAASSTPAASAGAAKTSTTASASTTTVKSASTAASGGTKIAASSGNAATTGTASASTTKVAASSTPAATKTASAGATKVAASSGGAATTGTASKAAVSSATTKTASAGAAKVAGGGVTTTGTASASATKTAVSSTTTKTASAGAAKVAASTGSVKMAATKTAAATAPKVAAATSAASKVTGSSMATKAAAAVAASGGAVAAKAGAVSTATKMAATAAVVGAAAASSNVDTSNVLFNVYMTLSSMMSGLMKAFASITTNPSIIVAAIVLSVMAAVYRKVETQEWRNFDDVSVCCAVGNVCFHRDVLTFKLFFVRLWMILTLECHRECQL